MLVEQCPVQPLHKAVALRASDAGCPVFDAFQLQKQFVGLSVGASAEFPAIVRKHRDGWRVVFLEKGSTDSLSMCAAVTGSLLVYNLLKA